MEANGLPVPPVMDTLIVNGEREAEDPAKKKKRKKKKNKSAVSGELFVSAEAAGCLNTYICKSAML